MQKSTKNGNHPTPCIACLPVKQRSTTTQQKVYSCKTFFDNQDKRKFHSRLANGRISQLLYAKLLHQACNGWLKNMQCSLFWLANHCNLHSNKA